MSEILACRNERSGMRDGHQSSFGAVDWLHLAATPAFALMAFLPVVASGSASEMICPAAHGVSLLGGMGTMYLLMAVFHAGPWFKLIASRRHKAGAGPNPG